jgi:RNase P subunit RPR2
MIPDPSFTEFANDDGFYCEQCRSENLRCELAEVTRRDDEHHIRFTCLACGHRFWERIDLEAAP